MQKFFICKHCGNFIGAIGKVAAPMSCCGEKMAELIPNTVDAANEKHLPEVTVSGDNVSVCVGSVEHPMTDEHYIKFIYLETEKGGQRKCLEIGKAPKADFTLVDDKLIAVYEYCNLHGLWKTEV